MFKLILVLLGFGLATGVAALAQSTNPTGAISGSTNPTGAVGLPTPARTAPAGQPFLTQRGPAMGVGGNARSETVVMPNGGIGTATQNGNGTTTITHPNGSVEVVNTPR